MKSIRMVMIVGMVLTLFSGSAWAWDMEDHVVVAPNGKGDVLIYPLYAAESPYETNFWVTNTSNWYSVVCKIEFRSAVYTEELRDFFIFLSPNDVFKANIRNTGSQVLLTSTDDSVIADLNAANQAVWGNETANGFQTTLPAPTCSQDTNVLGYFEVFEAAFFNYGKGGTGVVNKDTILNGYGGVDGLNDATANFDPASGMYRIPRHPDSMDQMFVGSLGVLAGHMEIGIPNNAFSAAIRPTALRNYHASLHTKLTIAVETFLGDPLAHNSVGEVEAALSRNMLQMPYSGKNGDTYHIITFPTKKTNFNKSTCRVNGWESPFFDQSQLVGSPDLNCVEYNATDYDLMENSLKSIGLVSPLPGGQADSFCNEVNYINSFSFNEGWTRYDFTVPTVGHTTSVFKANDAGSCAAGDECIAYDGVPVIGTVLDFGMGMNMFAAAHTDTDVWEINDADGAADGNTVYYYYQYWDRAHYPTLRDINPPDSNNMNFGFRHNAIMPVDELATWPSFPSVPLDARSNGDQQMP